MSTAKVSQNSSSNCLINNSTVSGVCKKVKTHDVERDKNFTFFNFGIKYDIVSIKYNI